MFCFKLDTISFVELFLVTMILIDLCKVAVEVSEILFYEYND